MRGGPQGAQPHLGNGREPGSGGNGDGKNVQSLKQILTMGDSQTTSTPLATNVSSEENADLYKVTVFLLLLLSST
jgi:hypothetical protein